jgi:hypothetical protein
LFSLTERKPERSHSIEKPDAKLRPENVSSAGDWEELLVPEIDRQHAEGRRVAFRGDASSRGWSRRVDAWSSTHATAGCCWRRAI